MELTLWVLIERPLQPNGKTDHLQWALDQFARKELIDTRQRNHAEERTSAQPQHCEHPAR